MQTNILIRSRFRCIASGCNRSSSNLIERLGLPAIEGELQSLKHCFRKCMMFAMEAFAEKAEVMEVSSEEALDLKCQSWDDLASRRGCAANGCSCCDSSVKGKGSCRLTHVNGEKSNNNVEKLQDEQLLRIWQAMTRTNEVPRLVKTIIYNLKALEEEIGEAFSHRGPRGRIQGRPGVEEDLRHRASYQAISTLEEKLQFFSSRQVACRVLGSKNYLCASCWLPQQYDCMCGKFESGSLWHGIKLWVYMHPKDFLRKNNTGKLLWQVFGAHSVQLCIYGIEEHEASMWSAFCQAGNNLVWCIYPERDDMPCHIHDLVFPNEIKETKNDDKNEGIFICHFILMDGTWSNSKAMIRRLQDRARLLWSGSELPSVSLSPKSLSVMHSLRPQPSKERTCTAAAAALLLRELSERQDLSSFRLDISADTVDTSIQCLFDALRTRRSRVGRAILRHSKAPC